MLRKLLGAAIAATALTAAVVTVLSKKKEKEQFLEIAKENGYDVEELNTKEIVVAKKLYSTDGAILSDIYNVANQVNCLNGTYEGYKID